MNDFPVLALLDQILKQKYKSKEQSLMKEVNSKADGSRFTMECNIHDYINISHLLYRFDIDKSSYLFPYFEERSDYHKMCDYVLFAENTSKLYVILVELKNTTNSPKKQLDLTEQFLEFIIKRIKMIEKKFTKGVEFRKVGVKTNLKMTTKGYSVTTVDPNLGYIPLSDINNLYIRRIIEIQP